MLLFGQFKSMVNDSLIIEDLIGFFSSISEDDCFRLAVTDAIG